MKKSFLIILFFLSVCKINASYTLHTYYTVNNINYTILGYDFQDSNGQNSGYICVYYEESVVEMIRVNGPYTAIGILGRISTVDDWLNILSRDTNDYLEWEAHYRNHQTPYYWLTRCYYVE